MYKGWRTIQMVLEYGEKFSLQLHNILLKGKTTYLGRQQGKHHLHH